jgi:hypothetical protein
VTDDGTLCTGTCECAHLQAELAAKEERIAELETEVTRLREAAAPIAERVKKVEQDEADWLADDGWDEGFWSTFQESLDDPHVFGREMGALRDAALGPTPRCGKCGSALVGDYYEDTDSGGRRWWRGCFYCGPLDWQDVTSEHEDEALGEVNQDAN